MLPVEGTQVGTSSITAAAPGVGQRTERRLSPLPAAVATTANNKHPEQLKSSTFSSRANDMNSRGVQAVMAKLEAIGCDVEAERAWAVDDRKPGGGTHEFRAAVFDRKIERLSKRCEEAHEEADDASEAYLLLLDRARR